MPFPWVEAPACGENFPACAGGHLQPKTERALFFYKKREIWRFLGELSPKLSRRAKRACSALRINTSEKNEIVDIRSLLRFLGTPSFPLCIQLETNLASGFAKSDTSGSSVFI